MTSKHTLASTQDAPFDTFQPAKYSNDDLLKLKALSDEHGIPMSDLVPNRVYRNSRYQVAVWDAHSDLPDGSGPFPRMIWLSIKRNDKEPIHDWRELQRIKNAIVGKNHDAVELYPAEDRVVDTSNQYHLFVLADSRMRFPFGWTTRLVSGSAEAEAIGAKQRPIDAETIAKAKG